MIAAISRSSTDRSGPIYNDSATWAWLNLSESLGYVDFIIARWQFIGVHLRLEWTLQEKYSMISPIYIPSARYDRTSNCFAVWHIASSCYNFMSYTSISFNLDHKQIGYHRSVTLAIDRLNNVIFKIVLTKPKICTKP